MLNSSEYWEKRYYEGGNSGSGSYGRLAEFKAFCINEFCKNNDVKKIVEWGCGDGNNLRLFNVEEYVGYDVSKTVVEMCKNNFSGSPRKTFIHYDGGVIENPEVGELSISLDVLYHLTDDSIYSAYMQNLFNSSSKYVGIYSYDGYIKNTAGHVYYRPHSQYIDTNFKMFKLIKHIENKYKRNETSDPDETSWCDFYFYEKNE